MNINDRRFLFQNNGHYHLLYRDMKVSTYEPTHTHAFWQCMVVTKGRITQIEDERKYYQVKGEVFIVPPGHEHSLYVFANDTAYYSISFSQSVLDEALSAYPAIKADLSNIGINYKLSQKNYAVAENMCATLMKSPQSTIPGKRDWGYHAACAAIIAILEDAKICGKQSAGAAASPIHMDDVVRYLEQYYFENINIDDIAEKFGFKRTTFCNRFVERTGISPKRYIAEKRIHEAMCLIDTTDLPLNKVAEMVGYNEFSTFYRNFTRMVKMSPSQYQNKTLKERDS